MKSTYYLLLLTLVVSALAKSLIECPCVPQDCAQEENVRIPLALPCLVLSCLVLLCLYIYIYIQREVC